jgi:hypothetical protein
VSEGKPYVFVAVEHANLEVVVRYFGAIAPEVAKGLKLRQAHERQRS